MMGRIRLDYFETYAESIKDEGIWQNHFFWAYSFQNVLVNVFHLEISLKVF